MTALATPGAAQHYFSGGGQIALTPVAQHWVVEAAPGVSEAALAQSLSPDFTIAESLPRDFYVVEEVASFTGNGARTALESDANVARVEPDYVIGTSTMGFTVTDYVRAGFGPGVTGAQVAQLNAQYGVTTVDSETFADGTSVYTIRVPASATLSTLDVANAYYTNSLTDWAKPDAFADFVLQGDTPVGGPPTLLTASALPGGSIDDPLYGEQWHLENNGLDGSVPDTDIDAERAWAITTGSASVIAGVVDTGVEDHEDFAPGQRLPGHTAPSYGDGDGQPISSLVMHGQAVAGLIAADFNATGVRGVSENTRIMSAQIFGRDSEAPAREIAASIDTLRQRGVHIMNHSWNAVSPDYSDDDIAAAFERASEAGRDSLGIVMVVSAGNNGNFVAFPATLDGVIAVGAVTSNNIRPSYSPFVSPGARRPDVVAPSSGSLSSGQLEIATMDRMGSLGRVPGNYLPYNTSDGFGMTSAAAPQVTGIAALMLAINPEPTFEQVKDIIEQTADYDTGCSIRWAGSGRVNAYEALKRTLTTYGGRPQADLVIPEGETWTFGAATVTFAPGARLIVDGTLNAFGTTFTEGDAAQGWGGIAVFDTGVLDLDGATVSHADIGVEVFSTDVTITGSVIEHNRVGIETGFVQDYCPTSPECTGGGRSAFTLTQSASGDSTKVVGNDNAGVRALNTDADISFTVMSSNGDGTSNQHVGLGVSNALVFPFERNVIEENGKFGVAVITGGDIDMRPLALDFGVNRVAGNDGAEIFVYNGGQAFLGDSEFNGRNSVYDETGGLLLRNLTSTTVQAVNTYWDTLDPVAEGAFAGPVAFTPVWRSRSASASSGRCSGKPGPRGWRRLPSGRRAARSARSSFK